MKLFLIEWMRENHPAVLEEWMDLEDLVVDLPLDIFLEERYGWIDQKYRVYMEGEEL